MAASTLKESGKCRLDKQGARSLDLGQRVVLITSWVRQDTTLNTDQVFFQDFEFHFRYFLKTVKPARFHPSIAIKKSLPFFCPFHGGLRRPGSKNAIFNILVISIK